MKNRNRILTAVAVVLLLLTYAACKKNSSSETPAPTDVHTMQPVMDAFKEKLKDEHRSYTRILNLPGKGFWADENGNRISARRSSTANRVSACPDPGEDYPSQSVYSVLREFTCGQGYRIEVKYDVILAYTPLLTNASNTHSFGRVWLFNSGGTRVWPTVTPLPRHNVLSIDNMGSAGLDPNGLPLTKYRITFRTDYIPESTFDASSSMQTYLTVYTDCPDYPTFVCPFSTQQSDITSQQNYLPCTRIDNVYWNPSFGLGASVAGVQAVPSSCYPWGYVFPEKQEIQINAGGLWQPLILWRWLVNPPPPPGDPKEHKDDGTIDNFDLWYIDMDGYQQSGSSTKITLAAGNYPVRYRNKQASNNNGGPCSTEPDGTWVTATWYISI